MTEYINLPPDDSPMPERWKLIFEQTGNVVSPGDTVPDFRGEKHVVKDPVGSPPHKPSSTGRIYTDQGEFYPSVCGCKWVPE